jgi:UDP:flavonoid glycosyltransferase YjiC (YdhE family)
MEPRRILFASVPFDGHFNPLTGIATHLQGLGHDVRWYAGPGYTDRLANLGIPHLPFRAAPEINASNIHEHFPQRENLKGLKLIRFEFKNVIVGNTGAYFDDVAAIYDHEFRFDALVCDAMFYAYALVAQALKRPVHVVQPAPMMFSSKNTPPNFAGLTPAKTAVGRFVHQRLRALMENASMNDGMKVFHQAFADRGRQAPSGSIFDLPLSCATHVFQSGVPGFAYPRRDLSPKVVFTGPLLPNRRPPHEPPTTFTRHLRPGRKVIVISQGTVDNQDPSKLITPALDALRGSGHLIFVATGGVHTAELRQAYPDDLVVIDDFWDFAGLFEHTDLFICNGGYGSILLSLRAGVPVLSAGVREGKNDVNAHVRYFGVGIDLRTEQPKSEKIRRAVDQLLADQSVKANVTRLATELRSYDPNAIITEHLFEAQGPPPPQLSRSDAHSR